MLAACERADIAFLPWFPLGSGSLLREDKATAEVAVARHATPSQVALAWLLQRSRVMIPIPGTGDPMHLDENMAAAKLSLTQEALRALD